MTKIFTLKTAYMAALMAAAASGSLVAMAISVKAEARTVSAAAALLQGVTLSSKAMVERVEKSADGSENVVLKSPKDVIVIPGDKVIFTLSYTNKGSEAASGFRATNPMPAPIRFIEAAEGWALVSVDGGKNFGQLSDLTVIERHEEAAILDPESGETVQKASSADVTRAAIAQDVTHVRWAFTKPIAPGEKGSVSYRGVVK
ncbi:MAG: hypothetical protein V3V15_01785 [Sphingorhabdus sp.]